MFKCVVGGSLMTKGRDMCLNINSPGPKILPALREDLCLIK